MTIDEKDVRERLKLIATEIHFAADADHLLVRGRQLRRRRKTTAAMSIALLIAGLLGLGLPLLIDATSSAPRPPATVRDKPRLAPLADVTATPRGWAPVAYLAGKVSGPPTWTVENPGATCGQHDP